MIQRNFASYRQQVKSMNPSLSEQDIYNLFIKDVAGNREVQSTPIVGSDGQYHEFYISVRNDGKIYCGKHSSTTTHDQYTGSGLEISDSLNAGYTFKRHTLEYFKDADSALAAEKFIVNEKFVAHQDVLNHVPGGDDTRHSTNGVIANSSKFGYKRNNYSKKKTFWPFTDLTVPFGGTLYLDENRSITCVVDDDKHVIYNGMRYMLGKLTDKVSKTKYGNSLYAWRYNGKLLSQLRDEVIASRYKM